MSTTSLVCLSGLVLWGLLIGLRYVLDVRRANRLALSVDSRSLETNGSSWPTGIAGVVQELAESIESAPDQLDTHLLQALRTSVRHDLSHPVWSWVVTLFLGVLGLYPLCAGLLVALTRIEEASRAVAALPTAQARLSGAVLLDAPTSQLGQAYLEGGAVIGVWLTVLLLQDLLLSGRVKEARFLRGLMSGGTSVARLSSASAAGHLLGFMAPRRDLGRPVAAAALSMLGVTAGWLVLIANSDLRAQQDAPVQVDVWPEASARKVELPPGFRLPAGEGGQALTDAAATAIFTRSELRVGPVLITRFSEGVLEAGWADEATDRIRSAGGWPVLGTELVLAADPRLAAMDVLDAMAFIRRRTQVERYALLLQRAAQGRQAVLTSKLTSGPNEGAVELVFLEGSVVQVNETPTETPLDVLLQLVRNGVRNGKKVVIRTRIDDPEVRWGRVVSLLAASDASCEEASSLCGLPGLGVSVQWVREE